MKDGLSVFQNSRLYVVKDSKLFGLKIYFQTLTSDNTSSSFTNSSSSCSGVMISGGETKIMFSCE